LTAPGCSNCKSIEKTLKENNVQYDLIDITVHPEYLSKYQIYIAPGIVIDDKLEFTGTPKKEELLKKLKVSQ
jgi:glutaredoxin